MVFSSLLFLFLFFSIHITIYFLVPGKYKNGVLLASSLVFYAWAGPIYLPLLIGETFIAWIFAKLQEQKGGRIYTILAITCLLILLGIFKYLTFILSGVQYIFGAPKELPNIVLPIGISFYTFQLISYVVDVAKAQVKAQQNFGKLLLYASLFHQCIAGPIVRYETVEKEINERHFDADDMAYGVRRFSIGLAKKVILANGVAAIAENLAPIGSSALSNKSVLALWLAALCFMLQIYLDFSAYSDMAIGMGRMIGFHYLENFNYPYVAHSVKEFWRRWHISLSSFFRDYVYIPLGGSRCSSLCFVRNITVVWLLTGLWHGASLNYVLWGLYYLAFLLLERFVIKERIPKILSNIYTWFVVIIGWVIFRFESLTELKQVLAGMFGANGNHFYTVDVHTQFFSNLILLIFAILACFPLGRWMHAKLEKLGKTNPIIFYILEFVDMILPCILLLLSMLALVGDSYNPFLYFRF